VVEATTEKKATDKHAYIYGKKPLEALFYLFSVLKQKSLLIP